MSDVDAAIARINKEQGGKGKDIVVARLGKMEPINVTPLPTGILSLDVAIGVGGFPRGRIIEVYGPASHGKTTVALTAIAETHAAGGEAAFVDTEHALDPDYARALGVDVNKLVFSQPSNGEQALEVAHDLIKAGVDLVVVDSVAGLVPRSELDGNMGDAQMGVQARLMSQAMRVLNRDVSKAGGVLLFTNQIRMKLGVMFGNPETTPGGEALKFWASVRMDVRRRETFKVDDKVIGIGVRVKVVKNKVAAPYREAEFDIYNGEDEHPKGVDRAGDLLSVAEGLGIVEKSGTWYSFAGEQLAQGKTGSSIYLTEHPEVMEALKEQVLAAFKK